MCWIQNTGGQKMSYVGKFVSTYDIFLKSKFHCTQTVSPKFLDLPSSLSWVILILSWSPVTDTSLYRKKNFAQNLIYQWNLVLGTIWNFKLYLSSKMNIFFSFTCHPSKYLPLHWRRNLKLTPKYYPIVLRPWRRS